LESRQSSEPTPAIRHPKKRGQSYDLMF